MTPRQVKSDDRGQRLAVLPVLRRAFERLPGLVDCEAHRLGHDGLLGLELAVECTVGEAGCFGDRIDAGAVDPLFAKQASRRSQDSSSVLRRLGFRYTHEKISSRPS